MTQANDRNGADFDFSACIAKARADYPDVLAETTFVDCSSLSSYAILKSFFDKKVAPVLSHPVSQKQADLYVDSVLNSAAKASSVTNFLAMHTKKYSAELLPQGREKQELFFTFFHEIAHLVIPNENYKAAVHRLQQDYPDDEANSIFIRGRNQQKFEDLATNISEAQADCFAAITGLRDGWLTKEDVLHIAAMREAAIPHDDHARHLTHFALRSLADEYHPGKYDGMSPQRVRDTAFIHGKIHAATTADVKSAKHVFFNQPAKKYDIEIIDAPDNKPKKNGGKPGPS